MPGILKTNSVIAAPLTIPGTERAISVIIGIKAFLKACLYITLLSASPFALAVLK
jgi:hypothetical protein